jgi:amino acid transporter
MVAAAFALANGTADAHLSLTPLFNPDVITPSLIFGALSLAVLSFLGFDAISTLSEEAHGGAAAVGRATYLSLFLTASIFVVLTYTASLFVLDRTSFPKGDATDAAFYDIALMIGGPWLKWTLAVPGVIFSGLPGALAAQVATTRLLYSMARDGKLPRVLAHVSPKRQVPERAALLVCAVSLVLGVAMAQHVELLTSMVNFGALLGFLLLHTSVIVYFARRTTQRYWWRSVVVAAVGFVIIAYVMVNLRPGALLAGAVWSGVGAVALALQKRRGAAA